MAQSCSFVQQNKTWSFEYFFSKFKKIIGLMHAQHEFYYSMMVLLWSTHHRKASKELLFYIVSRIAWLCVLFKKYCNIFAKNEIKGKIAIAQSTATRKLLHLVINEVTCHLSLSSTLEQQTIHPLYSLCVINKSTLSFSNPFGDQT